MKQFSSVSIVVPVYNESAHLAACLDAILQQSVAPYEVIVVDNNSNDDTVAIARRYDFVTILHETRQGVVFARDTGFNYAGGAIIGRIDADTILDANWVETVQSIFAGSNVGAVTGSVTYHDMAYSKLVNSADLMVRTVLARVLGDEVAIQGANMAIRRAVWQDIRSDVCRTGGMHEDFDLAIHTNWGGHKVAFNPALTAAIGYRQAGSSFLNFVKYAFLSPKTYARHGLKSHRYMYPVVALVIVCYVALKLLHRGYDKEAHKFSWSALFGSQAQQRVNPATYVDY